MEKRGPRGVPVVIASTDKDDPAAKAFRLTRGDDHALLVMPMRVLNDDGGDVGQNARRGWANSFTATTTTTEEKSA